jgi:uncharacterized protein
MTCPRCNAVLAELDRDGITIDRCDRCRGIWLDRGELEKLLTLRSPTETSPQRHQDDRDYDDDDDDDRRSRGHDGRRRSWWEILD